MKKSVTCDCCLECMFVANCWSELTYEKYLCMSLWLSKYVVICEHKAIMSACDGHCIYTKSL